MSRYLVKAKPAVLDQHLENLNVERVQEGEGWERVKGVPLLWKAKDQDRS